MLNNKIIKKQILKNNKKTKQTILNLLFESKSFYGELLKKTKNENYIFLHGIREKYSIIDLKNTLQQIKKILIVIQQFLNKKKNILIIGDHFLLNHLKKYNKKKNIFIFNDKWKHGLLTNNNIKFNFSKKKIQLIIILNPKNNSETLLQEAFYAKIPIIGIINTDISTKYITYPIFTNCENIKSLYFIIYLIKKIINTSKI